MSVEEDVGHLYSSHACHRLSSVTAFSLRDLWLRGQSIATSVNFTRAQGFSQASIRLLCLLRRGKQSSFLASTSEPAPFSTWNIWDVPLLPILGHHLQVPHGLQQPQLANTVLWVTTGNLQLEPALLPSTASSTQPGPLDPPLLQSGKLQVSP